MPGETVELCDDCGEELDLHCDDCGQCNCEGECIEDEEETD